jgi:branched-chain amino acid transport system substrate-binding protein
VQPIEEANMSRPTRDMGLSRRNFVKTAGIALTALGPTPLLWRHARAAEEIRIGALCELSGSASTIGTQQAQAIKLAVDEINKNGGILGGGPGIGGRQVKLFLEDTESKVATGLAKAKKLVERDRVDVLTGIILSSVSLALQEYVNKEAKIPYVNSGSGNPAISDSPACGKYSFQGQANARQTALPCLNVAKKHGTRWFFLADDYSFGRESQRLMKEAIKLGGPLQVVGEEFPPFGSPNYAPYLSKVIAAKPDVIGMVIWGAGYARVLKQLKQMGSTAHIHQYSWSQVDGNAAGEAVLGMTAGESFMLDNPKVPRALKFSKAFHAAHGEWPDPAAAKGYNGVEMLALAIDKAKSTKPDAVVAALETMVFKDSLLGELRVRECDHAATTPVFLVEGKHSNEYKYYAAYAGEVADPTALLTACGKTGCEPSMKK